MPVRRGRRGRFGRGRFGNGLGDGSSATTSADLGVAAVDAVLARQGAVAVSGICQSVAAASGICRSGYGFVNASPRTPRCADRSAEGADCKCHPADDQPEQQEVFCQGQTMLFAGKFADRFQAGTYDGKRSGRIITLARTGASTQRPDVRRQTDRLYQKALWDRNGPSAA